MTRTIRQGTASFLFALVAILPANALAGQDTASENKPEPTKEAAHTERQPRVVDAKPVAYPQKAKRREIEGSVTVAMAIDSNGKVKEAEIMGTTTPDYFDKAAMRAANNLTFEPGYPADHVVKTFVFKLED